jgi:hypothetical protein
MAEHAGLRWDVELAANPVHERRQFHVALQTFSSWIDADDRVTASQEKSVEDSGRNALQVVGWMVRLKPRGHASA